MPNDVHPQVQTILDATAQAGIPKVHDLSPTEARQLVVNMANARREQYPPPQVASVENTTTGAQYVAHSVTGDITTILSAVGANGDSGIV